MKYDEIKNAWNAQADDGNRWHSLSEAKKIEWAAIHAAAKERAARQAAQEEAVALKERIARAGVEQRRALHKALQQEREAFEKWARWACYDITRVSRNAQYESNITEQLWQCWQARAALNAAPEDAIRARP